MIKVTIDDGAGRIVTIMSTSAELKFVDSKDQPVTGLGLSSSIPTKFELKGSLSTTGSISWCAK